MPFIILVARVLVLVVDGVVVAERSSMPSTFILLTVAAVVMPLTTMLAVRGVGVLGYLKVEVLIDWQVVSPVSLHQRSFPA